jgi:hypothetical protein
MMSWQYIAGYFDGEGTVNHYRTKSGARTRSLAWYNTHRESLEAMCSFMGVGRVIERTNFSGYGGKKRAFVLVITNKDGLVVALDGMTPHLLIKRDRAIALRADLVGIRSTPQFGAVAATSTAHLLSWYASGDSHAVIAKRLGVTPSAVNAEFKKRGIASRPAGGSHMHGKPKSEETRRRMRDARGRRQDVKVTSFTLTEGNA